MLLGNDVVLESCTVSVGCSLGSMIRTIWRVWARCVNSQGQAGGSKSNDNSRFSCASSLLAENKKQPKRAQK